MGLSERACNICDQEFMPRYRNKGFHCSVKCYKKERYKKFPVRRSVEKRKRDTKWMKEYRNNNRDRVLSIERLSRARARERLGEKKWKERQKNYNLKRYGLSLDNYNKLLKEQDGLCAICQTVPEKSHHFHVDHNHDTGEIRGLLCFLCNYAMAAVDKKEDWCRKAAVYASGRRSI